MTALSAGAAPRTVPKAVVFDWDNTLVDTWDTIHHAMNSALAACGHPPWTAAEARARIGRSMRESFPAMFGDRHEEARAAFHRAFTASHLENLTSLPGAAALLRHLRRRDIPMAIVSNKTGPYLRQEVARMGWSDLFATVVGAGDAARDKPAPEPLAMALAPLHLTADPDVWFVGDAPVDVAIARATGCTAALIHADGGRAADLKPDFAFHSLAHLRAHL